MNAPGGPAEEIYLKPGEFYFGEGNRRVTTVLGSCVTITMWHPLLLHGGMCHFRLPSRNAPHVRPDGNYADEAMALFMSEIRRRRGHAPHYVVKVFGGANMFEAETPAIMQIGAQNIEAAFRLLAEYGFSVAEQRVGNFGRCRVQMDLWNGETRVQQIDHRRSA